MPEPHVRGITAVFRDMAEFEIRASAFEDSIPDRFFNYGFLARHAKQIDVVIANEAHHGGEQRPEGDFLFTDSHGVILDNGNERANYRRRTIGC